MVITALRDETGELRGFGKVTRDFTERRLAEETLRQSEERFRSVFDHSPIGITLSSLDAKFIRANRALTDFLG